ncbi:MAG: MlaD family protein [Verrucomicrobiota bacterium]
MSKSRLELKVGLFVFIGLALLGLLLLQFSKGASIFRPTYTIYLTTENAGGLKKRAGVLMSGVQVGSVADITLNPDGKSVTIALTIYKNFIIRDQARFSIEQAGFLGDNYVAVDPMGNAGRELKNGDHAQALEPFDLQEVARSALGFLRRVDDAAKNLNDAISDVRKLVLNQETLTNLSATVSTMRVASDRVITTVDQINGLFATNGPLVSVSASNIAAASEELKQFSGTMNGIVESNRESIATSVKNIESSTALLKSVMEDTQAGKGVAGTLLHNEEVATNLQDLVRNLSITSSNLNQRGLWGILWRQKTQKPSAPPPEKLKSPKTLKQP